MQLETGDQDNTNNLGIVSAAPAVDAVIKRDDIICDYSIITTEALSAAVTPLLNGKADWSYYARVVTTPTIQEEVPAATLKDSIHSFFTRTWDNKTVPPHYVVLAGAVDSVPIHVRNFKGALYTSDHYYATGQRVIK